MADPVLIEPDDPRAPDIGELLRAHLAFARANSPPEDVHALDLAGLTEAGVTVYSARRAGELLGIGALKELDPTHGELKSMHTAAVARRRGVGRAMVEHLLGVAASRGYGRVSLETGSMDAFAPARALYSAAGFVACEPFGDYSRSRNSSFMTLVLVA